MIYNTNLFNEKEAEVLDLIVFTSALALQLRIYAECPADLEKGRGVAEPPTILFAKLVVFSNNILLVVRNL